VENFDCEKINSRILIEESIWLNLNMQTIITIKPILHLGEEQLAIFFPFNKSIDYAIRSVVQSKNSFSLLLQKDSTYFFKNNNQNTVRIYYEH